MNNPFEVRNPEIMSPEDIISMFVMDNEERKILGKKHTFIWGSRGSGKSMLLKYLEPQCQTKLVQNQNSFEFIGIYYNFRNGMFNLSEFLNMNKEEIYSISEHMLIMQLSYTILTYICNNIVDIKFNGYYYDFLHNVSSMCNRYISHKVTFNSLEEMMNFFDDEFQKMRTYLRKNSLFNINEYDNYLFVDYHSFLLPFIRQLKRLMDIDICFYFLLDNADNLLVNQQQIINTWMSNRDQNDIVLKVSAIKRRYYSMKTVSGWKINEIHDYSEVNLDYIYIGSTSFPEKAAKVIEKRLQYFGIENVTADSFFPADKKQDEILKNISSQLIAEWSISHKGSQQDYLNRYKIPRLFQHLASRKVSRNYAGFNNLIHISSGVMRNLIDPCFAMYIASYEKKCRACKKDEVTVSFIPAKIQNDIIYEYSKNFLLQFDEIRNEKDVSMEIIKGLEVLIESLGRIFSIILHAPKVAEARRISFTINDINKMSEFVTKVLDLGVEYGFLQKGVYRNKKGAGTEPFYIFSRRLAPIYNLDPSAFQGRLTLSSRLLELACTHTDEFIKHRLKYYQLDNNYDQMEITQVGRDDDIDE